MIPIVSVLVLTQSIPDDHQPDIHALIAKAQQGNRDAVATLYQLHAEQIFRYTVRRVASTEDAEDITAEVFIAMVEGLPNYKITGAPFEAWLYRIAAHRIADYYRRTKRVVNEELSDELAGWLHDDDFLSAEQQMIEMQNMDAMRAALSKLPEEQQTILILRFVERKTHEEVGAILGKSAAAVKGAQFRALAQLTELLGQKEKPRHYIRGKQ